MSPFLFPTLTNCNSNYPTKLLFLCRTALFNYATARFLLLAALPDANPKSSIPNDNFSLIAHFTSSIFCMLLPLPLPPLALNTQTIILTPLKPGPPTTINPILALQPHLRHPSLRPLPTISMLKMIAPVMTKRPPFFTGHPLLSKPPTH